MPLYAIGDIQGCHAELCELLTLIGFSPHTDTLWLTGDLVNRGPDSRAVLREVMALGDAVVTVLGNHDLHLLTVAAGHRDAHRDDTLAPILEARDRDELLDWLAHRPLAVADDELLMVHAGVLPQWSAADVLSLAAEVENVLRGAERESFLRVLYGDEPHTWRDDLSGYDRLRLPTRPRRDSYQEHQPCITMVRHAMWHPCWSPDHHAWPCLMGRIRDSKLTLALDNKVELVSWMWQ